MSRRVIQAKSYPIQEGESWWVVHPNNGNVEFFAPIGAITVCTKAFEGIEANSIVHISDNDEAKGYISITFEEDTFEIPYYIFARYFDAEAFVKAIGSSRCQSRYKIDPLKIKFRG